MTSETAFSALNRFGLGARPGEADGLGDARDWLLGQLRPGIPGSFSGLPGSRQYLAREQAYLARARTGRNAGDDGQEPAVDAVAGFRQSFGADLQREYGTRLRHALATDQGFLERLVRFWSNHFAVSVDKFAALLYAAPMEREAIRPHLLGKFGDLLVSASQHPGMLRYLDNAQSIGERSPMAERRARRGQQLGLNENLAREILELHTLGVDGGYTQDDVRELARALTGWSTPAPLDERVSARRLQREPLGPHGAVFRGVAHEPGARVVLGKRYREAGADQAEAILRDLALHPSTARHLAGKLARHFVADDPPAALVDALAARYLDSGGDLGAMTRALVGHPLAWSASARKFKTPDDFLVSALRAFAITDVPDPRRVIGLLDRMGQPPFNPRSPAGFADDAGAWAGADGLFKRMQVAEVLAGMVPPGATPGARAQAVIGPRLDAETRRAMAGAESPAQGIAVLLASPAFQWRT
ncbi:DUF1800 domain-containing protein [Arenimonas donghaensis]|uniref:DUF1800 domain-containing protein n=1 Tax=Arenimonas donghaensis DSM 18148 = HO3-R19 TaxID=1121014 RepID=A0A087MFK4_9GAMM|nr:DUF1800 domain-containing protein [Arenimonas donghaensis]KFL35657.1 hypothetical protein N788_07935 [Arenimonas donghaensis DSM 18148 = HO3-R19]